MRTHIDNVAFVRVEILFHQLAHKLLVQSIHGLMQAVRVNRIFVPTFLDGRLDVRIVHNESFRQHPKLVPQQSQVRNVLNLVLAVPVETLVVVGCNGAEIFIVMATAVAVVWQGSARLGAVDWRMVLLGSGHVGRGAPPNDHVGLVTQCVKAVDPSNICFFIVVVVAAIFLVPLLSQPLVRSRRRVSRPVDVALKDDTVVGLVTFLQVVKGVGNEITVLLEMPHAVGVRRAGRIQYPRKGRYHNGLFHHPGIIRCWLFLQHGSNRLGKVLGRNKVHVHH